MRADHRVRIERIDAERVVQLRISGAHVERTVLIARAHAPRTFLMEVAGRIAERVHAAERKAGYIGGEKLDRVRQPVAVHPVEVALVNRVTACPRGYVVQVREFFGHVELVTKRQGAPVVLQTDIRLASELSATESELSIAYVETRLEYEYRLQAAAEIFDALEADPVAIRNAVVELHLVGTTGGVHVRNAGVQNAIQRDAALCMDSRWRTYRTCCN